jgi:hypothetical protein
VVATSRSRVRQVFLSGEPSRGGEPELRTAAEWLGAVRNAEHRGELLTAFDLAERGLARHPDDISLKHRAVLALARAGSTEEASRRFDDELAGQVLGLVGGTGDDYYAAATELEALLLLGLALRLGCHVGPVFHVEDPVTQALSFMGSHVSRTVRIEPVTPPGSVYVTEPFAAALVLAGRNDFVSDYVGHMPAAKDFGRLRMYSLRHR